MSSKARSKLRPVDEVLAEILASVQPIQETERLPLAAASGRYLAEDVVSLVDVPPAAGSAMDGYAFQRSKASAGEWLTVSARIAAGSPSQPLAPGTLARIFTGASLPEGADTVVMQENTEVEADGKVRLLKLPKPGENVRAKGEDIAKGSPLLAKGARLTPAALALLAAAGQAEALAHRCLRVAILATGNELIEPGQPLAPGQIYNANPYALAASLEALGMEAINCGTAADTPAATEAALSKAAAKADAILSTGGVSVGEEDHLKAAVQNLGQLQLWKLAIKPGKPLAFGQVQGCPILALPGNPASAFVTFHIIAKPYLVALAGGQPDSPTYMGIANFTHQTGSRREYLRVRTQLQDGQVHLQAHPNQASNLISPLAQSTALAQIEPHQTVRPGTPLPIHPY